MHLKKVIFKFLLLTALAYGLLAIPIKIVDSAYGDFYRKTGKYFLSNFSGTGFVVYSKTKDAKLTRINVGNSKLTKPNGETQTREEEFNTRTRGFLPTLLLMALIIASPVPIKRKLFAVLAGFILIMAWIFFKQWIHFQEILAGAPYLKLDDYTAMQRQLISLFYNGIVITLNPSFIIAVFIWILVTFRKEDISIIHSKSKK